LEDRDVAPDEGEVTMHKIVAALALGTLLVASEARAKPPVKPPPPPPVVVAPAVDVQAKNVATIWTELPATLFTIGPDGAPQPCPLPCSRSLDVGQYAYFGGEGVQPSKKFRFLAPGTASFEVTSGAHSRRIWEIVYFSIGGAAVAIGSVIAAIGASGATTTDEFGNVTGGPNSDLIEAGLTCAGVGLIVVIGGIIYAATSSTTYKIDHPQMLESHNGRTTVFTF
jgi:hypothetical protein